MAEFVKQYGNRDMEDLGILQKKRMHEWKITGAGEREFPEKSLPFIL